MSVHCKDSLRNGFYQLLRLYLTLYLLRVDGVEEVQYEISRIKQKSKYA